MSISIYVPTVPVAQPRPKATTVNGKAHMYEAKKSHPIHTFKATVKHAAREAYEGPPLTGPVELYCMFVFPRHKNRFWKKRAMHRYRHVSKPDVDNLIKGLADALTGIIFADDKQVVSACVHKWHASGDEQPHVRIVIHPTDEEDGF